MRGLPLCVCVARAGDGARVYSEVIPLETPPGVTTAEGEGSNADVSRPTEGSGLACLSQGHYAIEGVRLALLRSSKALTDPADIHLLTEFSIEPSVEGLGH